VQPIEHREPYRICGVLDAIDNPSGDAPNPAEHHSAPEPPPRRGAAGGNRRRIPPLLVLLHDLASKHVSEGDRPAPPAIIEIPPAEQARRVANKTFRLSTAGRFQPGLSGNPAGQSHLYHQCRKIARQASPEMMEGLIDLAKNAEDERVRSVCLGYQPVARAGRSCARSTRFARDSSLEGEGFEPSVPRRG
jgi:hypothetical protein